MQLQLRMDLVNLIFNVNKLQNTCCFCLTCNENEENVNIFDLIEIQEQQVQLMISLQDMLKTILPGQDIFLARACNSCADLIIKLFILLYKRNIKKNILKTLINRFNYNLDENTDSYKTLIVNLHETKVKESITPVICQKCDMKFSTSDELDKHTKFVHYEKFDAKICQICGKVWPTTKQLKVHLNCHRYRECPFCHKTLKAHAHYNKHVKKHMKIGNNDKDIDKNQEDPKILKNNSSAVIKKAFTTLYEVNTNTERLSNDNNLYNDIKNSKDDIKTDNKNNEANIPTLKQLAYKSCYKNILKKTNQFDSCNFSNSSTIIENCALLTDIHKSNDSANNIDLIIRNDEYEENKVILNNGNIESQIISKDTADVQYLDKNQMNPNPIGIYKNPDICVIDDKTDTSKANRKGKIKKYYLCQHCSYKSVNKTNLEGHYYKKHLNIRPYICNICSKSFYSKRNMNEHISTHNTQKLMCELCGISVVSKKTLEIHLKIHNGVKKFNCDRCNKYFLNKHHCNEHMKRCYMTNLIYCMFCNKKYGLRKDLNRHVAKVHTRIDPKVLNSNC